MKNVIIAHGGAPTAVINASLYGQLKSKKKVDLMAKSLLQDTALVDYIMKILLI